MSLIPAFHSVLHFAHTDTPVEWVHIPGFGCGAFAGARGAEVQANWDTLWEQFVPQWEAAGAPTAALRDP